MTPHPLATWAQLSVSPQRRVTRQRRRRRAARLLLAGGTPAASPAPHAPAPTPKRTAPPPPGSPDPAAQVEGATIRALTVVGTEGADHLDGRVSADVLTFIGPRNGARVIACEKVVYH